MANHRSERDKNLVLDAAMDRRTLIGGTAALGSLAMGAGLAGRRGTAAARPAAQELPREETLYVAGFQWGPPTTFNPFAPVRIWPASEDFQHLYQTLFAFNLATGESEPQLAKSIEWTDGTTAVITLQDGTAWHDGQPLTSADVVYTLDLPKSQDGLYYATVWDYLASAEATDDRTITLKLNPELINPGMVQHQINNIQIVPKHVWEARESGGEPFNQIIDLEPVGSGPYKIQAASPERVALERVDTYWGATTLGLPAPRYIVHPIFKSNDEGNLAFQQGEVDISQQFLPQVWQLWEDKDVPAGTWYKDEPYHLPGSIPLLFINVQVKPLDDVRVRKALAHSIDFAQIAATAMSRYSVPANASLVIPSGGEEKFYAADRVASEGWTYDPEKAKAILEGEIGATKGDDGIYVMPDGTRLGPFTAHCPYGWTDWMTALQLVAQNATDVGIEVTTDFPEAPVVTSRNQNGDFELALWYVAGISAASPWLRFRDVLDNRGVPEVGQAAFWNYNRYNNPAIGDLLDQAAQADEAGQVELYGEIDSIYRQDVPVIPLMYRPDEFYEYNESSWTGFPNADNPVAPPMQSGAGIKILYGLKPAGGS
jgi:peptide/nickel transport system substrate-binding protein